MMTDQQLAMIMDRFTMWGETSSSSHAMHVSGVVRGMVWMLTGDDPGTLHSREKLAEALSIPVERIHEFERRQMVSTHCP